MPVTDVPPLWDRSGAVRDRLTAAPGLLVALDFDGTLAPIVDDPDDATMDPEVRDRVASLASRPTVDAAVVSGRELADLRSRVDLAAVDYAGNHGLELELGGERVDPPAADRWRAAVDAVCDDLDEHLGDVSGCEVERKGLTATVHVRRVTDELVDPVERVVREAVAERDDLRVSAGKAIFEVRPAVDRDKGTAVERLVERAPDGWTAVYVGDDVTDEDAFAALAERGDGFGVLVGDRENSAADYRVPTQADVPELLAFVGECRDAGSD